MHRSGKIPAQTHKDNDDDDDNNDYLFFLKIIKLFQKEKIMELGKKNFEGAIICKGNDALFPDFLTKLQE